MIPKKLHQVWLGDKDMPEQFIKFKSNWRKLHPDWDYQLWTDKTISDKPKIKNLVDRCKAFSSKSNVVRLYAVYQQGGIYADTDVDWVQNFDRLLNVNAFASRQLNNVLERRSFCNAVFGATSRNDWVKYQIEKLPKLVKRRPPWGPLLMTQAAIKFKETDKFHEYPKKLFLPFFME